MSLYQFYQLKTKKSEIYENGLKQVSLVCESHPEIYCFIWFDEQEQTNYIQFVFNENVIEWFGDKGMTSGQTNRKPLIGNIRTGIHKGSRTIHVTNDQNILNEGLEIVKNANFPDEYQVMLQQNLSLNSNRI